MSVCERWVRVYTTGLPADTRQARRDEVASDVYEQYADAGSSRGTTNQVRRSVVGRTVRGAVDDLVWRREVARGMARSSARAVLTQAWWAPVAALVLVFDIGFAAAVLADEQSTMPGRLGGPALVLAAAAAMAVGLLVRVTGAGASGSQYAPYAAGAIGAAFITGATLGGLVILLVAAVVVVAAAAALLRGSVRSGGTADALILLGTLPALAMFWLVVPALLALAVIVGVLTSRTRTVPAPA